ncbi:MAG: hypothetical protein AB4290_25775 [Spirulina sp.]
MSLIHWNRSVVTFHLKEMVEDQQPTDTLAIAGLSAIAIVPFAVPLLAKLGRPLAKAALKSGLSLYYEGKAVLEQELTEVKPSQGEEEPKPVIQEEKIAIESTP